MNITHTIINSIKYSLVILNKKIAYLLKLKLEYLKFLI